ncbi:MAG: nucleotide sugar dehydrogenase [Thermoanaerobaculia bacterium]|nr:nucleotide sugar dehydrogenase [Thermoanaerobaculia bacterium]
MSTLESETAARLRAAIDDRTARVGVIGLGYVGLPLALTFVEGGFRVIGFDVDEAKVEVLGRGESYIRHISADRCRLAVERGGLEATSDFGRLGDADALLICVPTPLTENREPEMRFVVQTAEQIRDRLRPGQLVVLESTTYPGTTRELLRGILEQSGLVCGRDFFLAYSPEREDPGNAAHSTATIPKVVGGVGAEARDLADALYRAVVVTTVPVSDADVAEAVKLTENIFRAVNIALVNELKLVYDRLGIDVWEVLAAAETKPFGFHRFDPGPGWGGHCIPIDPFYLAWKARQVDQTPRFIELAGEVNRQMPAWVVEKLRGALAERGVDSLSGRRVLLLGLAYKRDVADPRESPAFEVASLLLEAGAEVAYHDPHIPVAPPMRTWRDLPPLRSQPLTAELLRSQDAVVIVTDHRDVEYELVLANAPLVVDTRGVYSGREAPNLVRA